MNKIFRPILILGSSSAVSVVAGILTNKYYAIKLGPEGLGLIGLFQNLLQFSVILFGMGISVGVVRFVAKSIVKEDYREIRNYQIAMWQLFVFFATALTVCVFLSQNLILSYLLPNQSLLVIFVLLIGSLFSLASGIQIGFINAHHRIDMLAKITITSQIFGAAASVLMIHVWGLKASPFVLLPIPLFSLCLAFFLGPKMHKILALATEVNTARINLLNFGLPYVASSLVGTGVILSIPFIVNNQLGQREVGYYRAANLISSGYLGVLVSTLSQDYFPRVSASKNDVKELNRILNQQFLVLISIIVPIIILTILLLPVIIVIIFSNSFLPAIQILRWQLVGDVAKLGSWAFSFLILAVAPSKTYFIIELAAGVLLIIFTLVGIKLFNIQGIGFGYLFSYIFYAMIAMYILHKFLHIHLQTRNLLLFVFSILICAGATMIFL